MWGEGRNVSRDIRASAHKPNSPVLQNYRRWTPTTKSGPGAGRYALYPTAPPADVFFSFFAVHAHLASRTDTLPSPSLEPYSPQQEGTVTSLCPREANMRNCFAATTALFVFAGGCHRHNRTSQADSIRSSTREPPPWRSGA